MGSQELVQNIPIPCMLQRGQIQQQPVLAGSPPAARICSREYRLSEGSNKPAAAAGIVIGCRTLLLLWNLEFWLYHTGLFIPPSLPHQGRRSQWAELVEMNSTSLTIALHSLLIFSPLQIKTRSHGELHIWNFLWVQTISTWGAVVCDLQQNTPHNLLLYSQSLWAPHSLPVPVGLAGLVSVQGGHTAQETAYSGKLWQRKNLLTGRLQKKNPKVYSFLGYSVMEVVDVSEITQEERQSLPAQTSTIGKVRWAWKML